MTYPSRITLANLTGANEPGWVSSLRGTSSAWSAKTLVRRADLQVALEAEDRRHVVVIYNSPVSQVAESLRRGVAHTEALVDWQDLACHIIELHEKYWDRMTVLIAPETLQEVEILGNRVTEASGLELIGLDKISFNAEESHGAQPSWGLNLAAAQLLSMVRPKELLAQLEALTLPTREKPYVPDVVEEFLGNRERLVNASSENKELHASLRAHKADLTSVQNENAMLLEQLHRTQEELERRIGTTRELRKKVQGLRRGRDYRKAKVADLQKQLAEVQAKSDWLRTVRDEHRDRARLLRSEVRGLEDDLQKLEMERKNMLESRSWKYTKMFRKRSAG